MYELLLLRHAEAMTSGPDGRDCERPLSAHGEAQAQAAGAWLQQHAATPDAVLCSPARRAQMTADGVARSLRMPAPQLLPGIYEGTPGDLLALIEAHAASAQRVLLVGHNPGLEQLLALLTEGRSAEARGFPPATIAWLTFEEGPPEPGRGRLHAWWSP